MNLRKYDKLIIFGGSFDPPHVAHVELPERVRQHEAADVVLYMPAGRAPHKLDRVQTPAHHRLAMLRLALQHQPHALILTDEIDRSQRGEPSYTVETLEALAPRLKPGAQMRLLIGSDQVHIFDKWKDAGRIEALAEPLVMVRSPERPEDLLAALSLPEQQRWRDRLVQLPPVDASSTALRERVRRGDPIDHLVHPDVAAYIDQHRLYR